jgi:hypothetical protein
MAKSTGTGKHRVAFPLPDAGGRGPTAGRAVIDRVSVAVSAHGTTRLSGRPASAVTPRMQ